jgi:hypothetical protein
VRANLAAAGADLVNLHYSLDNGPYNPALETVFPVPELNLLLAPGEVSWVSNGPPGQLQLLLTRPAPVQIRIMLDSDSDILGLPETAPVLAGQDTVRVSLHVPPQGPGFTERTVRVVAEYAGVPLEVTIRVVRPENLVLPALELEPVLTDSCQEPFREGDTLVLAIKNSNVLSSHRGGAKSLIR